MTQEWTHRSEAASLTDSHFIYPEQENDYVQIDWFAYQAESDRVAKGGEHYKPLVSVAFFPGVVEAQLVSIDESDIVDSAEVIGFKLDGQAYAFPLKNLMEIAKHVVNFKSGKRSIAVSYCDLSGCARVLSSEAEKANSLGIGGLDLNHELVLLLNGTRYGHLSEAIPMDDVDFVRVSFGEWTAMHPNSRVYQDSEELS